MKRTDSTKIFLIHLFLPVSLFSQWTWQNPLPQGNSLYDIQFVNQTTGFAVGDGGTVLKTTDGGQTWIRLNAGFWDDLRSVFFINENTGYVGGINKELLAAMKGVVFKTEDGGETWTNAGLLWSDIYAIWFTDDQTGYAGGYDEFYKTIDGGLNWSNQYPNVWMTNAIAFSNSSTGFVCGSNGLAKTTNAGITWQMLSPPNASKLAFPTPDTGYIISYLTGICKISKTIDAGLSWTQLNSLPVHHYTDICFVNNHIGMAITDSGIIVRTMDGGSSWTEIQTGSIEVLTGLSFADPMHCNLVGFHGTQGFTSNQGNTWHYVSSSVTTQELNSIVFISSVNGFCAGSNGTIGRTVDGGLNWEITPTGTQEDLMSLSFPSSAIGFAAGNAGTVLKTENSGLSWQNKSIGSSSSNIVSLSFPNFSVGYAINDLGQIFKTIDGGDSWTLLTTFAFAPSEVCFPSIDTGFVSGNPNYIIKTTNGGISWTGIPSGTTSALRTMTFGDGKTGYAAGDNIILKTEDRGDSWQLRFTGPVTMGITKLSVANSTTCYALGHYYSPCSYNSWSDTALNHLIKTPDGGNSWTVHPVTTTNYPVNCLFFTDPANGFIAGDQGIILKTVSGGVITADNGQFQRTRIKIYPNPVHSEEGILNVILPENRTIAWIDLFSSDSRCIIRGYKLDFFSGPSHINLKNLLKGAYIIRITTDQEVLTRKILII